MLTLKIIRKTLNKLLLYIVLLAAPLTPSAAMAQDSIVFKEIQALPADKVYYKDRSFDEGFKEEYSGTDFEYERVKSEKTAWDRFKEWLVYWLNQLFSSDTRPGKLTGWTILVRVLAFLLLGVAIYFIARAILNKEGYWIFGKAGKKITIQDADGEDIHEMDFGRLVSETANDGNYRLALRYYYLWLLKKLSNREVIRLHSDKTNTDYLYEIRDSGLKKDFQYLSYVYDHSWYGEFPIDRTAFEKAERAFRKTLNTL